jgi:hypothetical protein
MTNRTTSSLSRPWHDRRIVTRPGRIIDLNARVSSERLCSSIVAGLDWSGCLNLISILFRRAVTATQLVSYSVIDIAQTLLVTDSADCFCEASGQVTCLCRTDLSNSRACVVVPIAGFTPSQ